MADGEDQNLKERIQKYAYWMATGREGGRTRNVHLGSCKKMDAVVALQKAREIKAEALGLKGKER